MLRAYKYELDLNNEQKTFLNKSLDCCRFVYNWCLALRKKYYENYGKSLSGYDLMKIVVRLKKMQNYQWLQEVDAQSLRQSIRNLHTSYENFFNYNKGFPKFKKRSGKQACTFTQHIKIDFENHKIRLPKIGGCKLFLDREFQGKIKLATVSKISCGKYFVSVLVETGISNPGKCRVLKSTSIGIDIGIKTFAAFSDGTKIENPNYLEKSKQRLKILRRRHSKKQKGSKRREKARIRVAKLYYKITCQHRNFLYKLASRIVSENQTIIIEDLNVKGMLKNRPLARSIQSVSWFTFFKQLEYKCSSAGKNLIKIGRFEPSSKICNECGCYNETLTLHDREWHCPICDIILDRDVNAAKNILNIGLRKYYSGMVLSRRERGVAINRLN